MKKIVLFVALMAGVALTSCNLDYFPSDELNSMYCSKTKLVQNTSWTVAIRS